MQRLILLLLGVLSSVSMAHTSRPQLDELCENSLSAASSKERYIVIPSNRAESHREKYTAYLKELMEPGGILEQLGMESNGQVVEFLQGRELNAMTSGTAGGYPVAHYLDGSQVMQAFSPRGSFALEVVYPGPDFNHGFYRDDNPEEEQMSILDHVIGHNTFAYYSAFPHYRAAQGLVSSRRLNEVLTTLYRTYNKDEVQRFYLWALTLSRLVDWYTPFYEPVSKFDAKLDVGHDPLGRASVKRHPKAPTENILSAFAANMAPHQPEWKREILSLILDAGSFRPALVHTQIMNEGWATLMQEVIPQYSKEHHHFPFWFKAQRVMQSELMPNLRDPYSLGIFCWRRIRERFEQRPEIRALATRLEKDRAFLKYATHEVIGRMDDSQFLRLAMDQTFVDRYKLGIVRQAMQNEMDPNLPPPQNPQKPVAQWIVVSKDAERVTQAIIDMVLRPKYAMNPRVRLMDFNRPKSGEIELVIDDEVGNQLPLHKFQTVASLYAMTQIIDKSISLEARLVAPPRPTASQQSRGAPELARAETNVRGLPPLMKARITVSQAGEVRVYQMDDEGNEALDPYTTQEFGFLLDHYIKDVYLEDTDKLNEVLAESQSLRMVNSELIAKQVDDLPYDSMVAHVPGAAAALSEYNVMVNRRMLKSLELASKSGQGFQQSGNSVRVKALPSQVMIAFDPQYAQQLKQMAPPAPVGRLNRTLAKEELNGNVVQAAMGEYEGGNGQVGGIEGNPGDRFWGPGSPPGGGKPQDPGEDAEDPSWVDVPPDLYSQFLGEKVKLPNLNKKIGLSRQKHLKPGRRINRMWGEMLPTDILENAHMRGYAKALRDGKDPDVDGDVDEMINSGFEEMQPRDYVVKSTTIARKPEIKAVVTFVLDISASTAAYMEAFKRFVFDVETLVAANYKGFDFRYIVFDGEAHVLKDKSQFFRTQLGGGTRYITGLEKAHKLFEDEYPRHKWDRFTFVMGDMEDFEVDKSWAKIKQLIEDTEFLGMVAGLNNGKDSPYLQLYKNAAAEAPTNPQLGLTVLDEDGGYRIEHIREVLKNDEKSDE